MKKLTPLSLIVHAAMLLLALTWLYPFIWMVIASLKPTAEIYTTALFSGHWSFDNYTFLFDNSNRADKPFLRTLFNSLFVSLTITACVTVTSMLVGYAVAKTEFRGRHAFKNLLIVQMVFPAFMFIIPQFVLMRELGLINSYSAMILPYAMSAWGIFMVSQSFKGTPNDYLYAARLDHASLWGILRHVMMPLNKAILAIVALFTFSSSWDNFLWPLIVMREADKMPFSVLLATFSKSYGIYLGPVLAGAVVQMLPIIILFILFRKYFLQGMSLSLK
ncbi:carbohydrate ABC transporter permease [Superficieibacter electus]|uniref:Carbohydrate ABC transporter permease n=1 Tax=Superficieibacter electus TaxID=2022662 RepID=A0A2P5GNJ7_9ENTR|nr:carbohydrate ABC transporter permease [Superficieibacter electus]POP43675.1 carbohydrate ABC transporter permease [Superficieibacter electus]POP48143.1 carbohydrate ABC transporter permease [Superficieibacter electus]